MFCYTAIGRFGPTSWFSSVDTKGRREQGMMLLGPDHKHSALFPERIGNYYYMMTRPLARTYVHAIGVWLHRSPDLIHWGNPAPILFPRQNNWDSARVGPGTSPIRIPMGWLFFYYGVDSEQSYHMGAAVLDVRDPTKVIARSPVPVLSPVTDWERLGRRADTVFGSGAELIEGNRSVRLFYGAADTSIGVSEITMTTLESMLLAE